LNALLKPYFFRLVIGLGKGPMAVTLVFFLGILCLFQLLLDSFLVFEITELFNILSCDLRRGRGEKDLISVDVPIDLPEAFAALIHHELLVEEVVTNLRVSVKQVILTLLQRLRILRVVALVDQM